MSRSVPMFGLIAGFTFSLSGCLGMTGGLHGTGGLLGGCAPSLSECVGETPACGVAPRKSCLHQQARQGCRCRHQARQAAGCATPTFGCATPTPGCGLPTSGCGFPMAAACGFPVGDCGMNGIGFDYGGDSIPMVPGAFPQYGSTYDGFSNGGSYPPGHCPTCQNQSFSSQAAPYGAPIPEGMHYQPMPNAPVPPPMYPVPSQSNPSRPMEPTPASPMSPQDPSASGEYFAPPITSPPTTMMNPGMPYQMMPQQGMVSYDGQSHMMMAPQMQMMPQQNMQQMPMQYMPAPQMPVQMPVHQTQYAPSSTPPAIQAF
ncbi:MAG TPA: hypothetical protein VNQ76_13585 [Planctomicrobium sp.]|nr:hypothetical protein [Planctomicrobium sp.]